MTQSNRVVLFVRGVVLLSAVLVSITAQATEPGRGNDTPACIDVEVNGYRALPVDCYQQLMTPDTSVKRPPATAPFSANIGARQPNTLGLFSLSALQNRMGNTLGKSAVAQRPAQR